MGSRIAMSSSSISSVAAATCNKSSSPSSRHLHFLGRRRSNINTKNGGRKKRLCFDTNNLAHIIFSVVIIITIFSWFRGGDDVSASTILRKNPSSNEPVFSLIVTLVFESSTYKDEFLQDIRPVVDYVTRNEPDTLAYKILQSDQNPLQVMIMERYKNKDFAYLSIHKSSKPFLEFRPKLQQMQDNGHVTISGHSYLDSNIGFINE